MPKRFTHIPVPNVSIILLRSASSIFEKSTTALFYLKNFFKSIEFTPPCLAEGKERILTLASFFHKTTDISTRSIN